MKSPIRPLPYDRSGPDPYVRRMFRQEHTQHNQQMEGSGKVDRNNKAGLLIPSIAPQHHRRAPKLRGAVQCETVALGFAKPTSLLGPRESSPSTRVDDSGPAFTDPKRNSFPSTTGTRQHRHPENPRADPLCPRPRGRKTWLHGQDTVAADCMNGLGNIAFAAATWEGNGPFVAVLRAAAMINTASRKPPGEVARRQTVLNISLIRPQDRQPQSCACALP